MSLRTQVLKQAEIIRQKEMGFAMKSPTVKQLKKKADKLWSETIRSVGRCEADLVGECAGNLQACHIIRRGNNAVKHDLDNGLCLCVKHHYWFDKGDKFKVTEWFNKKYPGRKEELDKRNVTVHYKKSDWIEIVNRLEGVVKVI